jgi:hypothetical protein
MSKRFDYAKKRRAEGRSLTAAVRELASLIQPMASQQGIDLQARLNEVSAKGSEQRRLLAERLQKSVAPLFVADSAGELGRVGSCVLVWIDSDFFALTAAHVIHAVGSALLLAPSAPSGGELLPLSPCTAHLNSSGNNTGLDVGMLVLSAQELGPFRHHVFLTAAEIDLHDRPGRPGLASFYFVFG